MQLVGQLLMQFNKKKNLLRTESGGLKVLVSLSERKALDQSFSLSDVTGYIKLLDGNVLKPINSTYGNSLICSTDDLSNYTKRENLNREKKYKITLAPDKTCLVFEYKEFVSPENKFTLEAGVIKFRTEAYELKFDFIPMVVKATSH